MLGGCALTPAGVSLTYTPKTTEVKPAGSPVKAVLIVRDCRLSCMRESHICGVKRNAHNSPTSYVFLTHPEPLETVVAHHARAVLGNAGFTVVASIPDVPTSLSRSRLLMSPASGATIRLGQGGSIPNAKFPAQSSSSPVPAIPPEASVVVELAITRFNCDIVTNSQTFYDNNIYTVPWAVGWVDLEVEMYHPSDRTRVIWHKAYSGERSANDSGLILDGCFERALNASYADVLDALASDLQTLPADEALRPSPSATQSP